MTNAQVLNPCVGGRLTGSVSSFRIANPLIGPRDYKSRGAEALNFSKVSNFGKVVSSHQNVNYFNIIMFIN